MKKLNLLNRIYLTVLVLLCIATTIKIIRYKSWTRYYFSASVCAPKTYPVYVRDCYFILSDGQIGNIGTGDVNDHRSDWGNSEFEETYEKQQLPVKLVLEYASYREKAFYRDTIDLPADSISRIFKSSRSKGINQTLYRPGGDVGGLNFLIGIANKGNVVVWLQGKNYEVTVMKHRIVAREPVGDQTYHEGRLSKKQYFEKVFYIDKDLQEAMDQGKDRNANYIDSSTHYIRPLPPGF